ncbi:MAG: Coiled-coil domain-containing protein 96 [Paramarteilia canceri]
MMEGVGVKLEPVCSVLSEGETPDSEKVSYDQIIKLMTQKCDTSLLDSYNRDELIKLCHSAYETRNSLHNSNRALEHKLVNCLLKLKSDIITNTSGLAGQSSPSNEMVTQYQESLEKYSKSVNRRNELENEIENTNIYLSKELESAKTNSDLLEVEKNNLEKDILAKISKENNNKMVLENLNNILSKELNLSSEISNLQLKNIKLHKNYAKLQQELKESNQKMTGYHLIDYEQLTAENQALQDKITERKKEVLKLNETIKSEIFAMGHINEKISELENCKTQMNEQVQVLEVQLAKSKRELNDLRIEKDTGLKDLEKQVNACNTILFASENVLKDFSATKDENIRLKQQLNST